MLHLFSQANSSYPESNSSSPSLMSNGSGDMWTNDRTSKREYEGQETASGHEAVHGPQVASAFQDELSYQTDTKNMKQSDCLFLKNIVDDCYQSRLLARVAEYYFVDNKPESFRSCRCPMENCRKHTGEFDDPWKMYRHLKICKFLHQGLIRCPECKEVKTFRTASNNGCLWDRPSLKDRAQEKFRAALATIKKFTNSQSGPGILEGKCQHCGHLVESKDIRLNIPRFDPDEIKLSYELDVSHPEVQRTLRNASELHAPNPFSNVQPSLNVCDRSNYSSHSTSKRSAISELDSSPVTELDSSQVSQGGNMSSTVSPTFAGSFTTVTSSNTQGQGLLTSHHQRSVSDFTTIVESCCNAERAQGIWKQPPQSTQQEHLLSVQTDFLGPVISSTGWDNCSFYTEAAMQPTSNLEQFGIEGLPEPPMMQTPPQFPDIGNYVASNPTVSVNIVPSMIEPPDSSPLKSATSYSSSGQTLESELSGDELSCPYCSFRPSGKGQNLKAYYRKHLSTHDKPTYECDDCGKAYTRRDNMMVHRRSKHQREPSSSDSENTRRKRPLFGTL